MSRGQDNRIDDAVVGIHPDLSTFQAELKAALEKQAAKSKQPLYKVKVVADGAGLRDSVRLAVKAQMALANQPVYKVKVVADATSLKKSVADAGHTLVQAAQRNERDVGQVQAAGLRNRQRAEEAAARDRTRVLERETRAAQQQTAKRNKELFRPQKIIDLGGSGIKPMNLLYGIVTAMTPALFAMGASAVQASTSIAALGSAGIGAALGISAVAIAFQGIGDLLTLRKSAQNEATTKAANSARNAATSADDLAQSKRNLTNAQRDEKTANDDLHKARREAIQDLEDLRQAVRDLDNQYKSDSLTVAEKKRDALAADRNFFATALDRARAHQDVADAETQLADTGLQRKQKRQDLKESVSKGVEGSDKVRDAKERIRDARDRTLDAQAAARKSATGGLDKTSSAAAQLEKKLKELAPAAKDMYDWFLKNEDLFKRLQKQIAQKTLPGFNTFLKAITAGPKGKSTLEIAAKYAGELGAVIGKYVGKFGEFTRLPLFRGAMDRIQKRNADAFDKLGAALLKLADPVTRILDKASPAFTHFADAVLRLSTSFATFIEKADKDGSLAQWFEDSRREAKKWFDIAGNILTILKNLFGAALPAGGSLVDRFGKFTQSLADLSGSKEGQKWLDDFFTKVANLPYAKIADFFKNATAFFAGFRAFTFLKGLNPIFTAIAAFAATNPSGAVELFNKIGEVLGETLGYIVAHPEAAATLLAIVAAAKLGKAVGFSIKLPAVDALRNALTSKFKFLDKFLGGGTTTATMTVHAGVVHVYGGVGVGGGGGGGGGTPVAPTGGGPGEKAKGDAKKKPGTRIKDALRGKNLLGGLDKFVYVPLPLPETSDDVNSMIDKFNQNQAKNNPALRDKIKPAARPTTTKLINDEGIGLSRLENNLDVFGKDSAITRDSLNNYIAARQARVKEYVDYIRSTQGPVAAAKAQRTEDIRSQQTLSGVLQKYGWAKTAAEIYTRQVFGLTEQTKKSKQANEDNKVSYDSMGNALDKTITKTQALNTESSTLKDTVNGLVGTHVIAFDTKNYAKVKKEIDLLYATQHVLYNPKYSNSAVGADSISSQNQFLDPKTGLPKKYMKAAGGPIFGPGTGTSDSIPAWLSDGEYVMPAKTVDHYGLGVMEKMRRRELPGYAAGGPVMPFIVNLPKKGFQFPPGFTRPDSGQEGPTPGGGIVGGKPGAGSSVGLVAFGRWLQARGYSVTEHPAFGGVHGVHVRGSYHYRGQALDVNKGAGTSAREQAYLRMVVPEAHRRGFRSIFMTTGHYNHAHFDMGHAEGGLIRKYDNGGVLPPGYSLAFNGTGQNETVRTDRQEKALGGATRLDRRDLNLLAQLMAGAVGNPVIAMDGRKVAETTNRYNYLPTGV